MVINLCHPCWFSFSLQFINSCHRRSLQALWRSLISIYFGQLVVHKSIGNAEKGSNVAYFPQTPNDLHGLSALFWKIVGQNATESPHKKGHSMICSIILVYKLHFMFQEQDNNFWFAGLFLKDFWKFPFFPGIKLGNSFFHGLIICKNVTSLIGSHRTFSHSLRN